MANTNIRLCVVQCFNASEKMLTEFKIPKERLGCLYYKVKCMISAFNEISGECMIYLEFERTRQNIVLRALQACGATQITLISFSCWDYATGGSSGLKAVLDKANEAGFRLVRQSMPSRYVNVKLDNCLDHEFDVVKKRRQMHSGSMDEDDPQELCRFEEFEATVLPALMEVSKNYQNLRHEEFLDAESDLCNGVPPGSGTVYVAVSESVAYPKIGATRRKDPLARLRELSRNVPSPFRAAFTISTLTPFRTEAEIHRHFDAFRIRKAGACTEFFDLDLQTIGRHLKEKYVVVDGLICK